MKSLLLSIAIAIVLSGCYVAIPDVSNNEYSYLKGNTYITKADMYIYKNPGNGAAYLEKPNSNRWKILPAATKVTVLSTYTRRYESGISHYAKCIMPNEKNKEYISISLSNNGEGKYVSKYVESILEPVK